MTIPNDMKHGAVTADNIRQLASKGPCGKRTYRTKRKAVVALDRIRAANKTRKDAADQPKSAYKCKKCGHWHLTSTEY